MLILAIYVTFLYNSFGFHVVDVAVILGVIGGSQGQFWCKTLLMDIFVTLTF